MASDFAAGEHLAQAATPTSRAADAIAGLGERPVSATDPQPLEFKARFRRHAFGWRSQPAVQRVKQAVTESKGSPPGPLARPRGSDLSRASLAGARARRQLLGAIGTAVYHAIEQLVPVIAGAAATPKTRDRCSTAVGGPRSRQMPYIESLPSTGEHSAPRSRSRPPGGPTGRRDALALSPDRRSTATSTAPRHA